MYIIKKIVRSLYLIDKSREFVANNLYIKKGSYFIQSLYIVLRKLAVNNIILFRREFISRLGDIFHRIIYYHGNNFKSII